MVNDRRRPKRKRRIVKGGIVRLAFKTSIFYLRTSVCKRFNFFPTHLEWGRGGDV